jgi:predicted phosphodiesterase
VGGRKIWLTHGHRYHAKERVGELLWWGRQYGVDAVVYGHSHIPDRTWQDGILLFNPRAGRCIPAADFPRAAGADRRRRRHQAEIIEI